MTKFLKVLFITNAVFFLGYTQNLWLLIPLNIPMIVSFIMEKIYND